MTTAQTHPMLLKDLQGLLKKLVVGYVQTARANPAQLARIGQRHVASEIGGTLDAFVDLCAHRTAVQVLLRVLYVRVLEDLELLDPPRIRGDAGLWAFRQLAPGLGVRAFLRHIFADMALVLPALFTPGEDELGLPDEALCQAIWEVLHYMDGDRLRHDFRAGVGERFDSRFLGDLYQDLDADIRKRFALLQTPEFVEKFILDKTLTPALVEFDPEALRRKGEVFRVIDPTCGSGHFLTGSFHRLADFWVGKGLGPWEACERALESVWGCDINPHAVDIARLRLLLEVRGRVGDVATVERLGGLGLNLRVLDSLVPWERVQGKLRQRGLFDEGEKIDSYGSQAERAANSEFLAHDFHVVVGNPPYITPKDAKKRDDYRAFWPNSAAGKYAMSAPFVERLLVLGAPGGFMGQITANSFMKREFGKKLVTVVLPKWDLTGVVDTSGAYIPGHGTPTVILLARCRSAKGKEVWAIQGKRGEPKRPEVAEDGLVWSAIRAAGDAADDGSAFVSVARVERGVFSAHPWSLGGGSASEIKEVVEIAGGVVGHVIQAAGIACVNGCDEAYLLEPEDIRRSSIRLTRPVLTGDEARDWSATPVRALPWMYDDDFCAVDIEPGARRWLWPVSRILKTRKRFGTLMTIRGLTWYELQELYPEKLRSLLTITFAEVATHNHFVLDRGGKVFKQTAPVIKLPAEASVDDHFDLLGLLNSSCLEFWCRQTFMAKGGDKKGDGGRSSSEVWSDRIQRDSTKLQKAPITNRDRQPRIALAAALDATATTRATYLPSSILTTDFTADTLADLLATGRTAYRALTHQLVALQEELDWLTYGSYGLLDPPLPTVSPTSTEPLAPGHRPFEIVAARLDEEADDDEKSAWWSRHGHAKSTEIPNTYSDLHRQRIQARIDAIEADPRLQLLETFAFKRRWQTPDLLVETKKACESYLLDRLEDLFAPRSEQSRHSHSGALSDPRPYRLEEIAAVWGRDPRVQAVIDLWQATTGYDLGLAAEKLLRSQALPDHDQRIYAEEGLRKRAQWRETWALQDREDAGESDLDIPVPPQYQKPDFQKPGYYDVRGKLDVPRERFVAFDDLSPGRWGWNGWRDLNRGLAQAAVWDLAANDPGEPLPMPTAADPRRCGATLGLWQSLDDVRRWSDPGHHAELRDLAESACGRSQCPCDVLPAWQNWRRTGKLSIAAAVQAPSVSLDERATALQILADLADKVRDLLEVREGGGTLADVAARWPWSREKLPAVLDDLLASGDVRTEGRGEGRRFLVRVQPGTKR